jgi:long-chain fatty acid transport protein
MKKVLSVLVLLLVCAVTYAGGYRVSLQGQRSLAMGHTGVAVVNNAEIAFFNPAGLVYLENKLNIAVGVSGVFADVNYQNTEFGQSAQTDSPTGTPFYFYASYAVSKNVSVGLAAYTPYGSSVDYEQDWAGSHLVNNIELAAIYVQPLISVKLGEVFSVGGGPIYVRGSVNFNRKLNRTLTDLDGNR